MLAKLKKLIQDGTALRLVTDLNTKWTSLAVRYETPHVDRVWTQVDDCRLNLHRIWPCEKALFHPHPWPSAVHILFGKYEMGIGRGGAEPIATTVLAAGSSYEMVHPEGWHYVKLAADVPSYSLMLTGKPWETGATAHPGKGVAHEALDRDVEHDLLCHFLRHLREVALVK